MNELGLARVHANGTGRKVCLICLLDSMKIASRPARITGISPFALKRRADAYNYEWFIGTGIFCTSQD